MSEFLTTRELASLLRVKERQIYDLAAKGRLPVRRVTGKLLFPRAEIEARLSAGTTEGGDEGRSPAQRAARPLVMAGGHDPLLEWALRESRSGVFVNVDGRACWRDVTLGARNRDMVEVVEGLRPGDVVVAPVDAAAKLDAGRRIACQ